MPPVKRDFALLREAEWTYAFGVPWPQPRDWSGLGAQFYNRAYLLVCPQCGEVWCRATCMGADQHDLLHPTWCVRERFCERCLPQYLAIREFVNPYTAWAPTHCPGSVLSVSRHEDSDTPSTLLWFELLAALPSALRRRELLLWARLDLALNPPQPQKEPASDEHPTASDSLVQFAEPASGNPP